MSGLSPKRGRFFSARNPIYGGVPYCLYICSDFFSAYWISFTCSFPGPGSVLPAVFRRLRRRDQFYLQFSGVCGAGISFTCSFAGACGAGISFTCSFAGAGISFACSFPAPAAPGSVLPAIFPAVFRDQFYLQFCRRRDQFYLQFRGLRPHTAYCNITTIAGGTPINWLLRRQFLPRLFAALSGAFGYLFSTCTVSR